MSVKNSLVRSTVFRRRLRLLEERRRLYETVTDPDARVATQVRRLNKVWRHCYTQIPFYRMWRDHHRLPDSINTPSDLGAFPELTKSDVQEHEDLIFQDGKLRTSISTGGSTGRPTRFPIGPGESDDRYSIMYQGRSWWGIQPLDDMIMFWGHSHLFGSGLRGRINEVKRRLYDRILNITRLNAYDMTTETIDQYSAELGRRDPVFLNGYTSCLYKLAKHMEERGLDRDGKTRLKVVIPAAETVTDADIELMERVYGVRVAVEYGMAETGVIAYSRGETRDIEVFWDAFLATVGKDNVLCVSTLSERLFPLIKYRTDDVVAVSERHSDSVFALRGIEGRAPDILTIRTIDGSKLSLSGILIVHILKSYPNLLSIQFEQLPNAGIRIYLVGTRSLDLARVERFFIVEIRKDHPNLDPGAVEFVQTDSAKLSIAGKEMMFRSG